MASENQDSDGVSSRKGADLATLETNGQLTKSSTSAPSDDTSLNDGTYAAKSDLKVAEELSHEKILQLGTQKDEDEVWEDVERKAQTSQYSSLGLETFEKEKKQGDLQLRSKQAILHLTWTEMRITQLEADLRKLQSEIRDLPDDFTVTTRKQKCPTYKNVMKRSTYDDFRTTLYSKDVPTQERPVLEVLIADSIPSLQLEPKDQLRAPSRRSTGLLDIENENDPIAAGQSPERLRIRSMPLIAHLERICRESLSNSRCWPGEPGKEAAPVVLLRPFKLLINYEQEIRRSIQEVEQLLQPKEGEQRIDKGMCKGTEFEYEDLSQALELLVKFIDTDLKPTLDLRRDLDNVTATHIEYADLWHLFKLGDVVLSRTNKSQAFKVVNFAGGRQKLESFWHSSETKPKNINSLRGFTVDCYSLCFDGTEYVPLLQKFSIPKFNGRRLITSLEVYPLRFEENPERTRRVFSDQGRQYLELTRSPFTHRVFKGKTLDEPAQELDAQVVVDTALAVTTNSEWRVTSKITEEDLSENDPRETRIAPFCEHSVEYEGCCGSDFIFKDLNMNCTKSDPFKREYGGLLSTRSAHEVEEDIMLLPSWVYAFVLRSRQWVTLKMTDLSEVQFENDFNELMFSESHKKTILALVETHEKAITPLATKSSTVGASLDLVKGKGTGLIILLHGEPGVGKTSTAECVADQTKRPLFPITCGDIGETGMDVEKNLHHNFRLAHKWGCVLLLDEADVFLAKRNKTDLRRNTVTSVFLRSLEYYAGILFLTTNRVGSIDPAFKSRIHLSLYYPRINLETTMKLYEVFLRRAKAEQKRTGNSLFKIKDKEILKFAKRHYRQLRKENYITWNGRQIRNAFQTAIALVEHEASETDPTEPKPVLGKAQFEIVAHGSREFDTYLIKTLQGADDDIAMRDQWRDDGFEGGLTTGMPSATKTTRRVAAPIYQSPDSSESEESEDETETESEDEYEKEVLSNVDSKPGIASGGEKLKGIRRTESSIDAEEYEQIRRFMAKLGGKVKQ